jgi:hypothetical protein
VSFVDLKLIKLDLNAYYVHIVVTFTKMANINLKGKVTPLQAPGVAQRVGRGTALLFHDHGTRRG